MTPDVLKDQVGNSAAVLAAIGSMTNFLPAVASLFTIIWLGIKIYESETVQNWLYPKEEKNELESSKKPAETERSD
jgi:hypothetical protein